RLECVCRIDTQVQLRGFRIELGEIEAALGQHPDVHEAAVVARDEPGGARHLIAYVVPTDEREPKVEEWRHFLQNKLPEYMVPAIFVSLDALPLTPNGKVDRSTLPTPEVSGLASAYEAPRTETEETLAAIWGEVLNLAPVGIHDNFFALGGHSLLATQVLARIRQACTVNIPLRALFELPTVSGLAKRITVLQTIPHMLATGQITYDMAAGEEEGEL
ncbi:MAG: phosphopantetheine-binding protein, partial [Candidatus Tectomicrobia bacterium]|nr:phosphopantetheine-binding protein [Candidatus Tectomicrobia bacterium]